MKKLKKSVVKFMWLSAVYLASGAAMGQTVTGTGAPGSSTSRSNTLLSRSESSNPQPTRFIDRFAGFAGSPANAEALILGLRNGTPITLGATGSGVTITPPTGTMGWGNVRHALDIASAELAAQGITKPTPEQIRIALLGGTLSGVPAVGGTGGTGAAATTTLPGVLALRAQGMGWGKIEKTLGIKRPSGDGGRPVLASTAATTGTSGTSASGRHGGREGAEKEVEVETETHARGGAAGGNGTGAARVERVESHGGRVDTVARVERVQSPGGGGGRGR